MSSIVDIEEIPILLFDGQCNLCNGAVQFILNNERAPVLKFCALESEKGKALLDKFQLKNFDFDSIVLIIQNRLYVKSSAVFVVLSWLKFPYPLLKIFQIFPGFFSDFLYTFIAKHRIKWWGKTPTCWVNTSAYRDRFL